MGKGFDRARWRQITCGSSWGMDQITIQYNFYHRLVVDAKYYKYKEYQIVFDNFVLSDCQKHSTKLSKIQLFWTCTTNFYVLLTLGAKTSLFQKVYQF